MDIRLLELMRRQIIKRLKNNQEFMKAKRAVLNINGLQGEERNKYSSLLSSHFGAKGGKASAQSKKQNKELENRLKEIYLEIMISDSAELQREEAIRVGQMAD